MKRLHIGNYLLTNNNGESQKLFDQITEVVGRDEWNVEIYGLNFTDDELPKDCTIVHYGSHEVLAMIKDGEVLDQEDMEREENINTIMCNTSFTREELEKVYDDPRLQKLLETYEWDDIFELLEDIVERDVFTELKVKSKLYNMKMICELAGVNYDTYKGFSSGRQNISKSKAKELLKTMKNAFNLVK